MKAEIRELLDKDRAHVWHHIMPHKQFEENDPLMIVKGEGIHIWDSTGKKHLDAVSGGVWTANVGYGRTEIADAIRDQLVEMHYFSHSMSNIPAAKYAARLIEKMPGLSRVYFSNSGSEANEKAFKIVRQIAHKKYDGKKYKILYRERDYHGTTITALSASGQEERKSQYGPYTPGFIQVPHCCEYRSQWGEVDDYGIRAANEIERVILEEGADTVGALCLEPMVAGGGIIEPPEGYWKRVQEICKKYEVLLIVDEVVCGLGRTGTWFGYQHYGIKPDIVTMAKGVASGYAAISCTVTTEEVFDIFKSDNDPLGHFRDISTYGGCTSGPIAALANMDIIERENLLENVTVQGDYLKKRLYELMEKYTIIGDVRGKGLFAGFELVKDRETKEAAEESVAAAIAAHCMKNGVVIGRTNRSLPGLNNTICLAPALIATRENIDTIVDALDAALASLPDAS